MLLFSDELLPVALRVCALFIQGRERRLVCGMEQSAADSGRDAVHGMQVTSLSTVGHPGPLVDIRGVRSLGDVARLVADRWLALKDGLGGWCRASIRLLGRPVVLIALRCTLVVPAIVNGLIV